MRLAVMLCATLLLCTLWAGAEELTEQQRSSLDTSALEQTAPEELSGVDALSLSDLTEGLNRLKETVLEEAASVMAGAVSAAGKLLLIVLLCSVAESAADAAGGMSAQAVRLCGAAGVTLTAFGDLNALVGLGKETIERLSVFTTALIPTLTTAAAASGGLTSAPARQAATLLFSNILTGLISSVLLPLTYVYAAACVASAAMDGGRLQSLCRLLRWTITTVLTAAVLCYTGYLTIVGSAASAADATAMKAAQMAVSGMVPVVGGILSSATESVFAGASVLRNSIGLFGVLGVLGFCAVPFLRLGVQFLVYKLAAALSGALSDHPAARLIQELGSVFALVMGMAGACALVTLLALISTITAVMP